MEKPAKVHSENPERLWLWKVSCLNSPLPAWQLLPFQGRVWRVFWLRRRTSLQSSSEKGNHDNDDEIMITFTDAGRVSRSSCKTCSTLQSWMCSGWLLPAIGEYCSCQPLVSIVVANRWKLLLPAIGDYFCQLYVRIVVASHRWESNQQGRF